MITSLALRPNVVSCHFLFAFFLHAMCQVHALWQLLFLYFIVILHRPSYQVWNTQNIFQALIDIWMYKRFLNVFIYFVQFFAKITFDANIHNKVHPLWQSIFSSIKIIHPCTRGKIFFHVSKNHVLHVKKYSHNILLTWT